MASRIGILIVFLSYVVLASGTFFDFPGIFGPHHDFFNRPAADDRIFEVPEQQQWTHNNGGDSVVSLEPGSNEQQPLMPDNPVNGLAEPEPGSNEQQPLMPDNPVNGLAEPEPGSNEQQPLMPGNPVNGLVEPQPGSNEQQPLMPGNPVNGLAEPQPEPVREPDSKPVQEPEPDSKPVQEPDSKSVQEPLQPVPTKNGLREMFYEQSCPQAERIVNKTIHKHFSKDPTFAAAFVRLFFHDCFVTGCDASILLDETPEHEEVEKKALQNGPLVRGYQVVDDIKKELEAACPQVVSCADILAFATRDSLVYAGVPNYNVAGGRRDSRVSLAKNVQDNLPFPEATAAENIQLFERKGMSLEDLILLIGAHSIGSAHCTVVSGRFHDKHKEKDIDRGYWLKMQTLTICGSEDQEVPFDPYSQHKMDSRFYKELLTNKALIESDHNLAREPRGNSIMKKLVDDQTGWLAKFSNAMRKLGEVEVLVGDQGEIRKQCRAVN